MPSRMRAMFGPCTVDVIPNSQFSKFHRHFLIDAWKMIGPSAEKNINKVPVWEVVASAYLEGLDHGYHAGKEKELKDA